MSNTPRTDAAVEVDLLPSDVGKVELVRADFARQLERELVEAQAALQGRTVSCVCGGKNETPADEIIRRKQAEALRWAADMKRQLLKSEMETTGEWLSRMADALEKGEIIK